MDTNDHAESTQRLQGQAAAAADGRMVAHESANLSSELREQFWRHVVEFETAETSNLVKELKAAGLDLLDPDGLNDEALHSALWTTIEALGRMCVYLHQTDHLSD